MHCGRRTNEGGPVPRTQRSAGRHGFTLLELLVVISIIVFLVAISVPSLGRARDQSKATHCLARLMDLGHATVTYGQSYDGYLPPAELPPDGHPTMKRFWERFYDDTGAGEYIPYAWCELLYEHVYKDTIVTHPSRYPVQRNADNLYPEFAICMAATPKANHAGHYRVYLPAWSYGTQVHGEDGRLHDGGDPRRPASLSRLPNHLVLMGDARPDSDAGDDLPELSWKAECRCSPCLACESSFISAFWIDWEDNLLSHANVQYTRCPDDAGPNQFAERHMGGANYLFSDFHAERSVSLRERLACDADLDGIHDVAADADMEFRQWCGCWD